MLVMDVIKPPGTYLNNNIVCRIGLSDHDLIFTVRKNKNSRPKPRLIEFRSMKNFNLPDFLADLKRVPWSSAYTFDNADDVWAHWRTLFKDVLDQHVPLKKKWIRGDQLPWISPDLLLLKFRTETNYSSATSGILNLLVGMIISGNVTRLRR